MRKLRQSPIKYAIFRTKWGWCGIAGTKEGLLRAELPCQSRLQVKSRLLAGLKDPQYSKGYFLSVQSKIKDYFAGKKVDFKSVPVLMDRFRPFSKDVLRACRKIEFGDTKSYAELAGKVKKQSAARAVGNAVARNPVPLIIPCHRVICSDRRIGKFSAAGGQQTKRKLLALESSANS